MRNVVSSLSGVRGKAVTTKAFRHLSTVTELFR